MKKVRIFIAALLIAGLSSCAELMQVVTATVGDVPLTNTEIIAGLKPNGKSKMS